MSTSSAPELTLRHAQYFAGAHASLATSAAKGRHLVATRDLANGDNILVSEAYLTALFPSFKKRICATCLRDGGRRLAVQCGACGQAWYCSEACRATHSSGAEAPGAQRQQRSFVTACHPVQNSVEAGCWPLQAAAPVVTELKTDMLHSSLQAALSLQIGPWYSMCSGNQTCSC